MKKFLESKNAIFWLISLNLIIRAILVFVSDLGNDEVYYVNYALFPAMSFFDHPPAIGALIRLTTANLALVDSDFFVRLGALIIGSINLILVYSIGRMLKNKTAGMIAAVMTAASFYASVIAGAFILPDTPQSVFWLLSIFFFVKYINAKSKENYFILLFGISAGFAMLSKYHAVFLWLGAVLYFIFEERKTLLTGRFWLAVAASIFVFSPVPIWNLTSPYSGISYHAGRVGNDSFALSLKHFAPEFFGQIFYNNPFNVLLIIMALLLLATASRKYFNRKTGFLLAVSLPLILTTLIMSLFNKTLPHWSGPAYYGLILLTAYVFDFKRIAGKTRLLSTCLFGGQILFVALAVVAVIQINTGALVGDPDRPGHKLGKDDFSTDLAIWEEAGEAIDKKIKSDIASGIMPDSAVIITHNWFPAGHLDYYFARPAGRKLFVVGKSTRQHEYIKINALRGAIAAGNSAWYITASNYFKPPKENILRSFESASSADTVPVFKSGKHRLNLFVWKMKNKKEGVNLIAPLRD